MRQVHSKELLSAAAEINRTIVACQSPVPLTDARTENATVVDFSPSC
jgi:hypothetical protein